MSNEKGRIRPPLSRASRLGNARRRFPPPWSVEDNGACFIVKDRQQPGDRLGLIRDTSSCPITDLKTSTRSD